MDPIFDLARHALSDRYRLERELGTGGGGTVFLAEDLRHGRQVAIKVLDPGLASAIGPERFLREIRLSARMMHPHILPLLDSGTADGLTWFAMAHASGGTLRERLRAQPQLPVDDALRITGAIADALDSAHRHGVVHRDVKPENILFEDGEPLLADFGIARAIAGDDAAPLTVPRTAIGTAGYMSPEQITGDVAITGASDQYALACVLFEMLGGRPPFPGATSTSILQQHLAAPPPNVRDLRPDVPAALADAIRRALSKTPPDRFPDAGAFRAALAAATFASPADEAVTVPIAPPSRTARSRRLVGLAALAAVVLAAVLVWVAHPWRKPVHAVRSLAVLPLSNLSGDSGQQYYADGMTEELILELSKISALRVISRTSVMSLRGKDLSLQEIGKRLGVDAVLEGSIARADDRLRVDLQLFQVKPEHQLWGERYDRPADKAVELQTEIARAVVGPVQVQMTPAEARRLAAPKPVSPAAHEAVLRGRFALSALDSTHFHEALEQFDRAVQLDPQYASAWAGLAQAYYLCSDIYLAPRFAMERVRTAAQRALEIDPDCAAAHAAMGLVLGQYDWKFAEAEREFRAGLRLDPSDSDCHFDLGYLLLETGRVPEAQNEFEIARSLDPLNDYKTNFVAYGFYCSRDFAEAERRYRAIAAASPGDQMAQYSLAMIALASGRPGEAIPRLEPITKQPDMTYPLALLGYAYGRAGRRADAQRVLERLRSYGGAAYVRPTDYALIYVGLGDFGRAMQWLDQAIQDRDENLMFMLVDPLLDPIRKDDRFRALVQRVGATPA